MPVDIRFLSFEDLPNRDGGMSNGLTAKIVGPLEALQTDNIKETLGKSHCRLTRERATSDVTVLR